MSILLYLAISLFGYPFFLGCFNIFCHRLRSYRGPLLFAAWRLPYVVASNLGILPSLVRKWHDKYGSVVRIAPDELAYETSGAWKDIYGVQKGRPAMEKDPFFLTPPYPGMPPSIGTSKNAQHAIYRRLLSHGFSNQALQAQEPLVMRHIDLLIRRLMEASSTPQGKKAPEDLLTWFMWATFDIVGDLAFGEPFGCLERCYWHPWTETVMAGFEAGMLITTIRRYLPLSLAMRLVPRKIMEKRVSHFEFAKNTVARRMERGPGDRPDFISYIMRHNNDDDEVRGLAVTPEQVQPNAAVMVLAGGHTTSTLLSGAVFHLLKRPDAMERLVKEVRLAFQKDSEMTFAAVSTKLPYMLAVLDEALRIYPPVCAGFPRMTPDGGMAIEGRFVPGDIRVSVFHIASARSARNFVDPDFFIPERWLDNNGRYDQENKTASQPFSHGPRSCLGKHVAYMEMRLILAKLLWNFDLRLDAKCEHWDQKKIKLTWESKPLLVHLSPVHGRWKIPMDG